MSRSIYRQFFPSKVWNNFAITICKKLKTEPVLLTALPDGGTTFFLKYIEEIYKDETKDYKAIIISFEILPNQTQTSHISSKIIQLINHKLNFPKYLEGLSCEGALRELSRREKKLLIVVNRFETLRDSIASMMFLKTLRAIDPLRINFLISSDISCLISPDLYTPAAMLTAANIAILPTYDIKGIAESLKVYKKFYNWNVPQRFSKAIYTLTGGIPGLVKYVAKYINDNNPDELREKKLMNEPGIKFKITNISNSLQNNGLIKNCRLNLSQSKLLYKLGVIHKDKTLRIKLLELFLNDESSISPGIDLRKILTAQEYQLFELFNSRLEEVIPTDEISNVLWGEHAAAKYSIWSIYKIVSNLKRKIGEFGLEIKNYRDRGYLLTKAEQNKEA